MRIGADQVMPASSLTWITGVVGLRSGQSSVK